MRRPRLLDLFCGAGGAGMGYHQAGFDVVGVDIVSQKHYPFEFIQSDAIEFLADGGWKGFDAIHASPPCQHYTALKAMWNARDHPDLVGPTRALLKASGRHYILENVPGAPMDNYIVLCGSMFSLGCEGAELRRHRLFEVHPLIELTLKCAHNWKDACVGVYGSAGGSSNRSAVIGVYGGHGRDRRRRTNGQHFCTAARAEAMGIGWMTGAELSQAIPPAYTMFIGKALLRAMGLDDANHNFGV